MMASSRDYSLFKFLFFCILVQQSIQNCHANEECLNPQFGAQQKIVVDYYFASDNTSKDDDALCNIINGSNGLISIVYRMGADTNVDSTGKVICDTEVQCASNRKFACNYKYHKDIYNNCNASLPPDDPNVATCIGEAGADDILVQNRNDYVNSHATVLPVFVVNQKFDPCFTTYTYDSMKAYFCTAFNNGLPLCTQ